MGNQRARSDNEKALKRQAILDAAWHLLGKSDGQLPTAIDIANYANISKGTVYVYFKTKEEIFLDLFLTKLREWVKYTEKILDSKKTADISSVASAIAQYPCKNPLFLVLSSMLHGILEKNAPFAALLEMKIQVAKLMEECGYLLNKYLPWLPPRQGAKSMLTLYTLYTSVFQSFSSPIRLKKELKKRNIDIFETDLEPDMVNAGMLLFTGLQRLLEQ
jgi:TetR/AcrR family transcriptional regulator